LFLCYNNVMDNVLLKLTIPICPRSKKNSMQIVRFGQRSALVPSKAYNEYVKAITKLTLYNLITYKSNEVLLPIADRINIQARYYMDTRRKVDITNLESALCDILKTISLIEDDNCRVVASTDGSRVFYDHDNPRTEVIITRNTEVDTFNG